jgi:hypothetical protein
MKTTKANGNGLWTNSASYVVLTPPQIYVVSYAAYLVLDTLPSFKPRFGIWGPLVLLSWDLFVTLS